MDTPQNPWKIKSNKEIYDNPWIKLTEYEVINPGGGEGIYGKVSFKNLAIGIIPIDEDGFTWLVGQYRFTLDEYSWEIPMGGGSIELDPLESAKRELKEETGITARKWKTLLKIHTSNSVTDEVGHVFLAEDLELGEPELDETETDLQLKHLPLSEAVKMALEGDITDSLSLAGLLKLARTLDL